MGQQIQMVVTENQKLEVQSIMMVGTMIETTTVDIDIEDITLTSFSDTANDGLSQEGIL